MPGAYTEAHFTEDMEVKDVKELKDLEAPTLFPPWLEENIGWLGVACGVILIIGYSLIAKDRAPAQERPKLPGEHAHPLVVRGPEKAFAPNDPKILERFSATVKNMGPAETQNLNAYLAVGESRTKLAGPPSLANGQEGEFSTLTPLRLPDGTTPSFLIECWNCPLFPGPPPLQTGAAKR